MRDNTNQVEVNRDSSVEADEMLAAFKRMNRRRLGDIRGKLLMLIAAVLIPLLWLFYFSNYGTALVQGRLLSIVVGFPSGLVLLALMFAGSREQYELATRIADLDDVRAIGALLRARAWPDKRLMQASDKALIRLLPRIKASDAPKFSRTDVLYLHDVFRTYPLTRIDRRNPELTFAALGALIQIGDESAIPSVKRVMAMRCRCEVDERIRVAAEECLAALEARRNAQGETLLRPADGRIVREQLLLRPATGSTLTDSESLLRPLGKDS